MESEHADDGKAEKKTRVSTREMTTPLFLLRCVQMGIALRDLDLLTVGMVNDMAIERENDDYKWPLKATQADIMKRFKSAVQLLRRLSDIPGFWLSVYTAVINTILIVTLAAK